MGISPDILKVLAAVLFGGAVVLLLFVFRQFLGSDDLGSYTTTMTSQRRNEMRRRAIAKSTSFVVLLALLRLPTAIVARMNLEGLRGYVRSPYARAGYPGGLDDDEVVAGGMLLSLALTLFGCFFCWLTLGMGWAWLGIIAAPLGFLMLVTSLQSRGEQRQREIMAAMPYVLDLLTLILRAGTSLSIALRRVVVDYMDHPVGDELGQVLAEMEMGAPRIEAFRRFAARLDNPDIMALTDAIVQSEELGWPLADTLERQSDRMAAERILRAQSKAGAAGVIVMLPSTLVLLATVILLFGPFIVRYFMGGYSLR